MTRCEHWQVYFEIKKCECRLDGHRVEVLIVICSDCKTSWIGNKRLHS